MTVTWRDREAELTVSFRLNRWGPRLAQLRVSEAAGADIEHLGLERGHRTLTITRKGGKVVTS